MTQVVPTVTAFNLEEFSRQLQVVKTLTSHVHIDLMDGDFAPSRSPDLDLIRWPHHMQADIHLMYKHPMDHVPWLVHKKPRMVIVQAEAHVHHMHFAAELHKHDIRVGLCILQETPVENVMQIMHSFDHLLVFSGNLGFHGGHADTGLLYKIKQIHDYYPDIEIGWDGGVNDHNARQLAEAGVDVLNVGGFIQKAADPKHAYATLIEKLGV